MLNLNFPCQIKSFHVRLLSLILNQFPLPYVTNGDGFGPQKKENRLIKIVDKNNHPVLWTALNIMA